MVKLIPVRARRTAARAGLLACLLATPLYAVSSSAAAAPVAPAAAAVAPAAAATSPA